VFVYYTLKYQAYADAWVVDDADLSAKGILRGRTLMYHLEQQYPTVLVFVAGPNCGQMGQGPSSTMRRTFNKYMERVCVCVFVCLCCECKHPHTHTHVCVHTHTQTHTNTHR
jgi:hypothetical protein